MRPRQATPPYKPGLLDRAISWLNPVAGLRRAIASQTLTRAYLAASPGDPWRPRRPTASATTNHIADAATLRAKSRFLIENVDYIGAGMDARVGMLVGTGITPRWSGQHGEILKGLWNRWVKVADADGINTYYGLQAQAVRAMDADGEVLVRLRTRRPTDGLPVPLQLQVLEVDWLDTTRQRNTENDNPIIEGKEYDYLGRCVAYWLWNEHPGETNTVSRKNLQSSRVDASVIIHLQLPGRPGQKRGFPRLSRCITRARDIQLLEDAELQRKNQEARLSVLASLDPSMLENAPHNDLSTGNLGELSSGGITSIPSGMNTTVIEPAAAPGFVDYDKFNIHMVCAGGGFTYEQATGDMTGVNFSSARIRIIDVRREVEQLQWLTIIPTLCDRVCTAFVQHAELAGKSPSPSGRFTYAVEHSTPRWEYTSPTDEVSATLDEIGGGLTSFSESIRRRNDDPLVRSQELAEDIQRFKDLGIWEDMLALRGQARTAPAAQPAASTAAAKPNTTPAKP